jgi:hypothetical protein
MGKTLGLPNTFLENISLMQKSRKFVTFRHNYSIFCRLQTS